MIKDFKAGRDFAAQIQTQFDERRKASHPLIEAMREVQLAADGDIIVPLPEMDKAEKPAVANLVGEAIDQSSMRVASTLPNLFVPPMDPRKQTGHSSIEYADITRRAVASWWEESRVKRINRRRARFMVGYGTAAVQIKPNFKKGIPEWSLRDPLQTYPNPTAYYDDAMPYDVIFAYSKPLGWLRQNYPDAFRRIWKGNDPDANSMVDVLEYVDEHCVSLVAMPSQEMPYGGLSDIDYQAGNHAELLAYAPNRIGMCNVVTGKRITLHKLIGQFNAIIGMYEAQAKLMALDLIAVEKAIFPDLAIVGQNGQPPQLLGDTWKDGRTGEINIIHNGRPEAVQLAPGYKTGESMDRLERGQRLHGVSPEWGGEQATNVRTGRAAEITMSAQLDFRIQEVQEGLADMMVQENKIAINVAKEYFGEKQQYYFVNFKNASGPVTYTPNKHFETDKTKVSFPMPGADANSAIIGIGQRVGAGMMSRETAVYIDPLIEDPEVELDRILKQELNDSLKEAIKQMAAAGSIPPADMAMIVKMVFEENMELADAVTEAQKRTQERQAQEVEPGSPESQPGLAIPGTGAEAVGVPIPEVGEGAKRFQEMMFQLRQPQTPTGGAPAPMVEGAGV